MAKPRVIFTATRKFKEDSELRAVALWLTSIDEDELDDLRTVVQKLRTEKKSDALIAQFLFENHRKELIAIVDFNESTGALFS